MLNMWSTAIQPKNVKTFTNLSIAHTYHDHTLTALTYSKT
jgi:hypothetical protein